jgi:hypothetical protein
LKPEKRNNTIYPFLAAIIIRLGMIPFLSSAQDALMEYGQIARNMLAGSGYSFTWFHSNGSGVTHQSAYMPPGQTFIQYIFLLLFGDGTGGYIALYLFQIAQFIIFLYLIGKISRLIFNSDRAEIMTLWLAALYPPFIYMTMSFGVTTSALMTNALVFYLAIRFSGALSKGIQVWKFALLFGVSAGLLLLFRGEAPAIIIPTLLLITWKNRERLGRAIITCGVAGLIALAILAPWMIRNEVVFHRFIPISTNGGFNFWRGNNAYTTGSPWKEDGAPLWTTDSLWTVIEPKLDTAKDFEKVYTDIHTEDAFNWISKHPGNAAALSLKKAAILWTVDLRSRMGGTVAYIMMYSFVLIGLGVGIFFVKRKNISSSVPDARVSFQLIILWCILMTLLAMIFFPLPRFQILLVGLYFPVVGFGISQLYSFLKKDRTE